MKIPVLEIFGPTIQGEGAVIGKKTVFIRTAGCDYRCNWCDSAFTWDGSGKKDIRMMTVEDIIGKLEEIGFDEYHHVTISGGNPALIRQIDGLVKQLHAKGLKVGLETQGSVWQDWLLQIDDLTISPKPPSSGVETDFSLLEEILLKLDTRIKENHVSLKVVIFDEVDLHYARTLHSNYPNVPFYVQVGNPETEATNDEQLALSLLKKLEWLMNKVIEDKHLNDVRVLPQLHTLVWGNKKGV